MQRVEIQCLAGYIEGGSLRGSNLKTTDAVEHLTRGGRDLSIWCLGANVLPAVWDEFMVGDKTWLDQMNCEIIQASNSTFACQSGKGIEGGRMIDYVIISKALLPLIRSLHAVMNAPWGPHFGLALSLCQDRRNFASHLGSAFGPSERAGTP